MYRRVPFWVHVALLALLGLPLVVGALVVDRSFARYEQTQRVDAVRREVERLAASAGLVIGDFLQLTRGLAAAIVADPDLNHASFNRIAENLFREYPEVRNVATAPDLVVRYVYPVVGNEAAVGLDYRELPEQYISVARARDTRQALVDGPVNLVQGGIGFIARVPVFVGEDDEQFWGIAASVLDADDLFHRTGLDASNLPVRVAIRRVADGTDAARHVYGDAALFDDAMVNHFSSMQGHTWEWAAVPAGDWMASPWDRGAVRTLLVIVVLSILLSVVWLVRVQRRLAEFNFELDRTLAAIPETLVETDRDGGFRRVRSDPHGLFAEAGLQTALGARGAESVRQVVKGVIDDGVAVPRRIEIRSGRRTRHVDISVALKPDGDSVLVMLSDRTELVAAEERERLRQTVIAKLGDGVPIGEVLAFVVSQVNRLSPSLAAALVTPEPGGTPKVVTCSTISRNLAADLISLVDNRDYSRRIIAELPPALSDAGVTNAVVVPVRSSDGDQLGTALFLSTAAEPDWNQEEATIAGTVDGITLAIERAQLNARLAMADSIFSGSSEGMLLVDEDERILAVNPAFTTITGYSAAEVIGRKQDIMRSDRHGPEFYRELKAALTREGFWTGEIWATRKDGSEFAAWLKVNSMPEDAGGPQRFISLFSDISEKKKADEVIWLQANYDALTQLPNRRLFIDRLDQAMLKARRDRSIIALLMVDLDGFKEVNDTFGHHFGDLLLVDAAQRISSCVRSSDTVSRIGGDEFTVTMVDLRNSSDVDRVTGAILAALAEPFHLEDHPVYITASVGITLYPEDAGDTTDMLRAADQAMYESKRLGRNRYTWYSRTMQDAAQARMQLATDLRLALQRGEFHVVYQPVIDLSDGAIVKAEALVRWNHPERGSVSPAAFIPVAEETGLIDAIGQHVLTTALADLARWQQKFGPTFKVAVNVSPVQFQEKYRLHDRWTAAVADAGVDPSGLIMEITEGVLVSPDAHTRAQLFEFQQSGFAIAIDDFGTGYSSLAYLRRYSVDFLKIDRSFTSQLTPGSNDEALCAAIIEMAHKLGLKVIAEGVETEEQHALLTELHCDLGQGYHFARPMPVEDFEAALAGKGGAP